MKPAKFLFFLTGVIVFSAACAMGKPASSLLASTPTAALTETPTINPSPTQTVTLPAILQITPVISPIPDWVVNFSDPILVALVGQKTDFQDEFSLVCVRHSFRLKKCPSIDPELYYENGISILNQGWFYVNPDSRQKPFYAQMRDEALIIKLPEGTENRESTVYNPKLIRKNFVLSFDFQFDETQPPDSVRFEFDQTADQSFVMELFKDKTWTFHWGFHNDWKSHTGAFDYFPPERINIMVIAHGMECAVYLNHIPLDYFSNCRTDSIARSVPWAVSFHVFATHGHAAVAIIDNVKLWDLDKIHRLP